MARGDVADRDANVVLSVRMSLAQSSGKQPAKASGLVFVDWLMSYDSISC